jgi:type III restriction enzyme
MKLELMDFQIDATTQVSDLLQEGFGRFAKSGRLTAVALSAPTGAGKTVIATAAIEVLMYGDANTDPTPDLTVLWVTDDPSLNQQTLRKMVVTSNLIKPSQVVTIDQTLNQKVLNPGTIYFGHIQQLGKGATKYNKVGNKRQYSLWETIGNTISVRGDKFILIIDEAHKGTAARAGGSRTITAQLIEGAGGVFPPTPVVLGISATPTRFVEAISKAGQVRTLEQVPVDIDAVRQSGLIKDVISIKHPTESQPSDMTLLEMAVADLIRFDHLWNLYSTTQNEPPVKPALVIQVKAGVSAADLRRTLDTMASSWNILDGRAIGHAFQDHTTLNLGTRSVRYIAPQDIQDDPHLRAVLFKEALTTGWDCPRAEVMMSFRTGDDHTYIAQLIGRMVRTPLARRIATDDVLNTVALYLPHYNDEQVAKVVSGLQSDEATFTSRIETDTVVCPKNSTVPEAVWELLASLPTYTRPGKYHRNDVARLNALAMLLVGTDLDSGAVETARKHITGSLAVEAARLGAALDAKAADMEQLSYQTQSIDLATGDVTKTTAEVAVSTRNIEDLFRRARRLLGDAAAKWYWDDLCEDGVDPDDAKLHVAALAEDSTVVNALETSARTLVDNWRNQHNTAISHLADAKRSLFYRIWQQAKDPQQVALLITSQITAPGKSPRFEKHLYANGKNLFPAKLTGWEDKVLAAELAKPSLVAWYRNPTGGAHAIAVPYTQSSVARTTYPDFVFFHEVDDEIVVDIVDPHRPDSADTGPKWTGLAAYAKAHGPTFRRVSAVVEDENGHLLSIDLKDPAVAKRLATCTNETDIRGVFSRFGGAY